MSSPASRERLGLLLGFIGMVIFGGTLPATRLAVSEIDPVALTALRTAIAGVCSLSLLLVLRRPLPPTAAWYSAYCQLQPRSPPLSSPMSGRGHYSGSPRSPAPRW